MVACLDTEACGLDEPIALASAYEDLFSTFQETSAASMNEPVITEFADIDENEHLGDDYESDEENQDFDAVEQHSSEKVFLSHANLDGFKTHGIDIETELELLPAKPEMVLLNETKTDEGDLSLKLTGYHLLSRRDRSTNGGGIAVFVRCDIQNQITQVETSEDWERTWSIMHTRDGPYLVCCWYRPPKEHVAGIIAMRGASKTEGPVRGGDSHRRLERAPTKMVATFCRQHTRRENTAGDCSRGKRPADCA